MSVDTLTLARELRAADLAPPQAEAIAAAIGRAVVETAATKADLAELRAATKADLAESRAATKADLAQLEERLGARVDRLAGELRTEVAKTETRFEAGLTRLVFWLGGIAVAVAGLAVALIKYLPSLG